MNLCLRPLLPFVPPLVAALVYGALARFLFSSVLPGVSNYILQIIKARAQAA